VAQMAGIRMRTIHWFDTQIEPRHVDVNDIVTVKGRFKVSEHWPDYVAKPEEWVFLNVGVPGPTFIRLDTTLNGMPQHQSTAVKRGEFYEYEVKLKARMPGTWHIHPLLNVWEAGPVAGPAQFVEISGDKNDFVNNVTLLNGETIDIEHYGLRSMWSIHLLWLALGLLWVGYWFRRLPVLMRRYTTVQEYGEQEAERRLISTQDIAVSAGAVVLVLSITGGLLMWANQRYPITMPLQTGKVEAPVVAWPANEQQVDAKIIKAKFDLPKRSLEMTLDITNRASQPVSIGEFVTGYARFVNAAVVKVVKENSYDAVAPMGLHTNVDRIEPGERRTVTLTVADALWDDQRLTDIVAEPDLRFAGLLFFHQPDGHRHVCEVGARLTPSFISDFEPANTSHGGHVQRETSSQQTPG